MEKAQYERALRREVGEDVLLQKVLDEASDWRGRAQHITLLQERLLSLQESQACPIFQATNRMPVPGASYDLPKVSILSRHERGQNVDFP